MQHAPKPGTVRVNPTPKHQSAATPAPRVALPAPPARSLTQGLQRLVSTPTQAQRQAAAPVLRAAQLDRQERQALAAAVQRVHAAASPASTSLSIPSPMPVPAAPGSPAALIQRLAARAAQAEGRHLNPRQHAEYTALQRQVAETLGQGYRQDRRPGAERNEAYGELIGQLHHHPLTSHVGRSVLGLVPASDRPALQRAVDLHVQRHQDAQAAAQQAQAQGAVQRQLAELNEQATRPVLQRIQERRGAGNPLPEAVRRHLEQGLNHDLTRVRIHDDAEADKLAKGVNAVAFTTGTDIYFRSGKFNPNTRSGLELLAHEVTHTVQQAQGKVGKGVDPDAGLESEARSMGAKLAQVMPSPKGLLPPVPHRDGPHAPGVYSQKAALQRVQDGAARHVSLKPLYDLYPPAMQRSPDLTLQRDWGILGDAANWVGDKVQDGAAALAAKGKELITKGLTVLPGYRELCLAFGKDLVTGSAVSGSAESILTTLTNWVPGPLKDILRALKETNVIGKAWDWFKAELGKLNLGGALGEIADAIKSADLGKAKAAVTTRISGVKNLILGSAQKIAEIGLTALTAALGPLGKKIMAGLKGAQGNIIKILKDPVAFAKNLIAAVKGGFTQFTGNAPKHLQNGVGQWLTGSTGIQFPARFDLQGVFLTALTVMGLTYQNMRGKLVRAMGPGGADKVQKAEQTVSALQTMKTGLHKAEEMKGEQGSTGKAIQDGIKSEVTKSLVMAGVQKLVTMLVPGGGFINAIIGAFQTVQTIVQQAAQIGAVITSALSGVSAIIAGNVTAAAGFIDRSLGGSIPVALAWLSKIVGLGNFGGKVKAIIQRVRGKLDGVVNKIVTKVKGIIDKLFGKGKKDKTKKPDVDGIYGKVSFRAGKENHSVWTEIKNGSPKIFIASTPADAVTQLSNFRKDAQAVGITADIRPYFADAGKTVGRGMGLLRNAVRSTDPNVRSRLDHDSITTNNQIARYVELIRTCIQEARTSPKKMDRVAITFTTGNFPQYTNEFKLQLREQQAGINATALSVWQQRRTAYTTRAATQGSGRDPSGDHAQRASRRAEKARLVAEFRNSIRREHPGLTEREIRKKATAAADSWLKEQRALHAPDQVAGGDPSHIVALGKDKVNESIGGQWPHRVGQIDAAVNAYRTNYPGVDFSKVKMNVLLQV
jgi:hypothetical protein